MPALVRSSLSANLCAQLLLPHSSPARVSRLLLWNACARGGGGGRRRQQQRCGGQEDQLASPTECVDELSLVVGMSAVRSLGG